MPTLDLPAADLQILLRLLEQHVPEAEIWAYGSRISGRAHAGSDLDLVLRNPARLDQPLERLYAVRDALSESDLPILVDVLDWARLPEAIRREIEQSHVVLRAPSASILPG